MKLRSAISESYNRSIRLCDWNWSFNDIKNKYISIVPEQDL